MYRRPQLTRVGDAREVVLGQSSNGLDLDTTHYFGHFQYAEEYPADLPPTDD